MLIVSLLTKSTDNRRSLRSAAQLSQDLSTTVIFLLCGRTQQYHFTEIIFHPSCQTGISGYRVWMNFWYYSYILSCKPWLDITVSNNQFKMVLILMVIYSATPRLREQDLFWLQTLQYIKWTSCSVNCSTSCSTSCSVQWIYTCWP